MPSRAKREAAALPDKYATLFGSLRIHRGMLDPDDENSIQLAQWDATPFCRMENCPAFALCDYKKSATTRCRVVVFYAHRCAITYFDSVTYKDDEGRRKLYITQAQWDDIGRKIIPIWINVCRAKIELAGAESLSYIGNRGNILVHPLVKSLSEMLFTITKLEKECGIRQYLNQGSTAPEPNFTKDGREVEEASFYEQLESEKGVPVVDPARKKKKIYKKRK